MGTFLFHCEGCRNQVTVGITDEYTLRPVACLSCSELMKPIKMISSPENIIENHLDEDGELPDGYDPQALWMEMKKRRRKRKDS